jgi:hypothetical protein
LADASLYQGTIGGAFDAKTWQGPTEDAYPLAPGLDYLVYFRTITPSRLLPIAPK